MTHGLLEKSALHLRVLDVGGLAKLVGLCLGLHSKLSRGGKHQQGGAIPGVVPQVLEVQHAWQQESTCLTTASFGNGNQVTPAEGDRPCLSLDWRGGLESSTANLRGEGTTDRVMQATL